MPNRNVLSLLDANLFALVSLMRLFSIIKPYKKSEFLPICILSQHDSSTHPSGAGTYIFPQ